MTMTAAKNNWLLQFVETSETRSDWLSDLKNQQIQAFLERGFPTRREELWKYTDVSYLEKQTFSAKPAVKENDLADIIKAKKLGESISLVFVNGYFSAAHSDTDLLPGNVVFCSLKQALTTQEELIKPYLTQAINAKRHPFLSLNTALLSDGVYLRLPKNTSLSAPIHILYVNANDQDFVIAPRNLFILEEGSQVTLLEEYCSHQAEGYFTNVVTDIYTENNSSLHYHKIQNESLSATHIADIRINQKNDSRVMMHTVAFGARLSRENTDVYLNERGAECSVNGFYGLNQDGQHLDNHVQVDHIAAHGSSEMMYKGIIDKKSHAVFNGKIHVHKDAQKTQSHQENHNLLLSPDAAIDTKPELEIYADDVKCAHGDTVGQLDQDALFYLRSRGIPRKEALKLLTQAFAADIITKIKNPAIKQRMNALLNEKLAHDD